ncbi:MAG TPA: 3-phosphoshikimate 1-carboxyvinyltransferase [Lachnospiraceae bacterium]|nr:3-phosphoshikimate 1-carboxyvinyltransferase [Lachnospiraceae bacterium]
MKFMKVQSLKGEIFVPGDKSISHRAIMFGSLANGLTEITNFLQGSDCLSTIHCFRSMGIQIENTTDKIYIHGKGLHGLSKPTTILDAGNSGTTTRLISGILSGQTFDCTLTGDESIQKRPMKRIIEPLSMMGANIQSIHHNDCAPLLITGKNLHGIHYQSNISSAQVKSAILLAGLYADNKTSISEPFISRNHSEIMLNYFGACVTTENTTATIEPLPKLVGQMIDVAGDISSAAYFMVAGLITPNSEILLKNVLTNSTRAGIISVIQQMGGNLTLLNKRTRNGESTADILVKTSSLHGITIEGAIIPTLIDEIPIITVMAAFANGTTIIKDAGELKIKESNRIDAMVTNLSAMGATIIGTDDGMIIEGGTPLTGATIDSYLDHRIAMSFAIAGINATGTTNILGFQCVSISYPDFHKDLFRLC